MADHITLNDTVLTTLVPIRRLLDRFDGGAGLAGKRVRVCGQVKNGIEEGKGTFALLELKDSSCPASLRVIVDPTVADLSPLVATGTDVVAYGLLKETPEGTEQKIELRAEQVKPLWTRTRPPVVLDLSSGIAVNALGHGDPDCVKAVFDQAKILSHVKISACARIRNALAFATHSFFQKPEFLYGHTPFITTSDCEGAGEMFQAITLTSDAQKLEELLKNLPPSEAAKVLVKVKAAAHPFFQEHGFLYGHTPFITTSDCEEAGEMFQATTLISDAQKLEELIKNLPPSEAAKVLVKVRIAMVGKYTGLSDSYLSVLKKRIMEGWEVSTGQSREEQMHVSKKFKEIECQCAQLSEETNLISQQIKGTKLRLILLSKISKAREHKDFVKARKLTNRLRELIASQNEKERAIKMTRTSSKD